jgi:hypothetical protein
VLSDTNAGFLDELFLMKLRRRDETIARSLSPLS